MVTAETAIAAVAAVAVFGLLLAVSSSRNTSGKPDGRRRRRQVARGDSQRIGDGECWSGDSGASVDIRDVGGLTEVRVDAPLMLPFGPRVTVSATSRVGRERVEQ
jgi:hypothetical protein